jgi:hypothetical protein
MRARKLILVAAALPAILLAAHCLADDSEFDSHRRGSKDEAISADGSTIALSSGQVVRLFDLKAKKPLGPRIPADGWLITSVAVAPDNKRVAIGCKNRSAEDGAYFEFDGITGKVLQVTDIGIGPASVSYEVTKSHPEGILVPRYGKPTGGR